MRFARLADQVFALFFDRLRKPHPAHFWMRTIVKNRVFLRWYLANEVIAFLGPALELSPRTLTGPEQRFPWVRRPLVVFPIDVEKGRDELIGAQFTLELEHVHDSLN